MILLAIESAGAGCSAAIWDSSRPEADGLRAWRGLEPARGQAERLIGLVETVLADAGIGYQDLGAIAVGHGPGSFTGLRSAVAAARGLALAAGLGVVPVSTLEALAGAVAGAGPGALFALLDARRGEVYAQGFSADRRPLPGRPGEPRAQSPQEAADAITEQADRSAGPVALVGSGAGLVRALLSVEVVVAVHEAEVDARLVACCAARRLAAGARPIAGFAVRPLYLRAPDARPPRPLIALEEAS